jgi:uncharacterized membrane protein YbaN (DUF454 family)
MTREGDESNEELRLHASPVVRALFALLGTVFVAVALVGVVLPVLPTTPFLLLAAACYVRASQRCYRWLLAAPAFGPLVLEWRRYRSIPRRAKLSAVTLLALTLTLSIVFFLEHALARAALALVGLALAVWLYRIPSRD